MQLAAWLVSHQKLVMLTTLMPQKQGSRYMHTSESEDRLGTYHNVSISDLHINMRKEHPKHLLRGASADCCS